MKIKSTELNKEDFAAFGQIMAGADVGDFTPLQPGDEFTWTTTSEDVDIDKKCCSGMLTCKGREMAVKKMEYHANTSEILVAVKNDYILCAAPKNTDGPTMDSIKAFRVKQGTVLAMSPACWHWIPFPINAETAEVLVIFREHTGDDDLIFADLAETVEIEL